ncbi:glycoside hydrolase family 71/99-like protein [Robiginitalea sp. M366]|uniref:glycoside hydrolase family 71/99-like protein n=1 Tax=Robiginitalea aestuariiviva TaxID=3036903 RepID=UPI00240D1434|nr:glycoside hydrolase family 71/99-like protein [Robiginitalea aestuariiviva]MDG1570834.1 glycoside hydrolase family 71/99-like protein [Robiginitalea aestuariiviva]
MKQTDTWTAIGVALLLLAGLACEQPGLPAENETPDTQAAPAEPVGEYHLPELEGPFSEAQLQRLIREELDSIKSGKPGGKGDRPMQVPKRNAKPVYVHYMPWFQSLGYDGYWGQHWTMANCDPGVEAPDGRRQIASYYYPLVGPYSSLDPYLHEYHFLLMKLSGIDGVIFDWYGSRDIWDYGLIREATESFMGSLEEIGLQYGIMYEDRVAAASFNPSDGATEAQRLQSDLELLGRDYFSDPHYLQVDGRNALLVFGPHHLTQPELWQQALEDGLGQTPVSLISLWGTRQFLGALSGGEFLWISEDNLGAHEYYYANLPQHGVTVGSAYPGFRSYYSRGGWDWGSNAFVITPSVANLHESLQYTHHAASDFVQLITWNDFGEGTMIEPSREFGFTLLETVQQYTGVQVKPKEMELAAHLYLMRQEFRDQPEVMALLDRSYTYFKRLNLGRVRGILMGVKRFYQP